MNPQSLETVSQSYQSEEPTAVALGCFDGIHAGHRAVLQATLAAASANACIPVVFTFGTPEVLLPPCKAAKELMSVRRKCAIFAGMGFRRLVLADFEALRNDSPEAFVRTILQERLHARAVCCGFNYRFGKNGAGDANLLKTLCAPMKIQVTVSEAVEVDGKPVSSTRIRAAVANGEMAEAERLLGEPFTIDFPVVHGRHLGHTLGFPTVNQVFPETFLLPRFGVYAARVEVAGRVYAGMTNVGVKPTVGADAPLAETYISGFSGDLYGETVSVSLLRFIRPERRFASLEALRTQIAADCRSCGCEK